MSSFKDLTKQSFGRLTVTGKYEKRNKRYYWECQCSCERKTILFIINTSLTSGNTKSCGCLQKEITIKRSIKHNMESTKFYNIWVNIKTRCNNKNNPRYKDYGGRGIIHNPEWEDFQNFYDDMYKKYRFAGKFYKKELNDKNPLSIERKDVNGNYCKENCYFIPLNKQAENRRTNKWFEGISPEGTKHVSNNQKDFAKKHNLYPQNISHCLKGKRKTQKGWKFRYLGGADQDRCNNACE
jgi:hypothetical protein